MKKTAIAFALVALAFGSVASTAYAKGGDNGGSGCTRIQSMTTVYGTRPGEVGPSVQTAYAVKPCDKKETINVRYTLTDDAAGTPIVSIMIPDLVGGAITLANYVPGNSYTVTLDVVSLKSGATLESRSQTVIATP